MAHPTTDCEAAKEWAYRRNATPEFIKLAEIYWEQACRIGINPVIAYCQAAKETGYGHFGGIVDVGAKNTCGMKRRGRNGDHLSDHMRFESWRDGVLAHLDHLALYAGVSGYPKAQTKDPRHYKYLKGIAPTVRKMGSIWASSHYYGEELIGLIKSLEEFQK
ncbi:glucosaminidase domain-containing protein [Bacteroides sp. 519]|uniref:glucosaminidase domain-containing protein n=1 Tax=Bacteroides sp. 519 TaxID=2302937 RepID=UPI0013D02861|nr:glucosaminidase domain-containing protein [Bacteroides sp. 519]